MQEVDRNLLLKSVAPAEREHTRERAWQRILHAVSQVRDVELDPNEDILAEKERIAEEVIKYRREHAESSSR